MNIHSPAIFDDRATIAPTVELRDDAGNFAAPTSVPLRGGNVFHVPALLCAARGAAEAKGHHCTLAVIRHTGGTTYWPLRIVKQLGVTVAVDLAAPVGQYSEVIGAPLPHDGLQELTRALRKTHGVDVLLARRVREDSGLASTFAPAHRIESGSAPYIDISAYTNFDHYAQRFGKRTRRHRQQRRRKLEQTCGSISFEVLRGHQGRSEVAVALGWKRQWLAAQDLTSKVFDNGANESVLLAACDETSICVSVLRAGGKAVAIEIGFSAGPHYAAYLGAFDPHVASFSAGQEQMLRTIQWCFENGFARYDLLAPASPYKSGWTDSCEPVHDYCVDLSARGVGYALLRKIAQSPMPRKLRDLSPSVRRSTRRYGLPAAGLGATAVALTILGD